MHVCQQTDCLACFLSQKRNIDYCPWHNSAEYASWHTVNFICVENAVDSTIRVVGRVGPFCDQSKSWMYHVVSHDDLSLISSCSGHAAFAAKVPIFRSHLNNASISAQQLQDHLAFMKNCYLPLQMYRHFFIRIGGAQDQFNDWLLSRQCWHHLFIEEDLFPIAQSIFLS